MTGQELISKFELYVDDMSELSTDEELALANKVYHKMCDDRDWEILKKEAAGTLTSTTSITIPSDFSHVIENFNYTDNAFSREMNAKPVVVFVNDSPYQVVNWSDRKQYTNNNNVCYVDIRNSQVVFPVAQSASATYSFDYKAVPADLTLETSPIFPGRFQHGIFHGMCVEDMVIQLFDKTRSYAAENQSLYTSYLRDMAMWNAQLQLY
tara:strand:- start:161 stop:787 length:627 start_codon:yes stop_codon:yes gene_type:complete